MAHRGLWIVVERKCNREMIFLVLQAEADMIREPMLVIGVQVNCLRVT